jgi:hypothetical protein
VAAFLLHGDEMESESIVMLLGGIYVALSAGLSEEGIAAANDTLRYLAKRPTATREESSILNFSAEAATIKEKPEPRSGPTLRLIQGGGQSHASVGWATASGNSAA